MNSKYVVPNQQGNATWIVVGIIALIALGIAWWAFNRTGDNLSDEVGDRAEQYGDEAADAMDNVGDEIDDATEDAQLAAARVEARTELLALQVKLEADENYDEAAEQADEIEADLKDAYANASVEAQAQWEEVEAQFDNFEAELRAGTADALDSLADLITGIEADIETDAEVEGNANVSS